MKKKTTEKRKRKEFSTKNVIEEWNRMKFEKKMGVAALLVCLWMLVADELLGDGNIIGVLW